MMAEQRNTKRKVIMAVGGIAVLILAVAFVYVGSLVINQMPSTHPVAKAPPPSPKPALLDASYSTPAQPLADSPTGNPTTANSLPATIQPTYQSSPAVSRPAVNANAPVSTITHATSAATTNPTQTNKQDSGVIDKIVTSLNSLGL